MRLEEILALQRLALDLASRKIRVEQHFLMECSLLPSLGTCLRHTYASLMLQQGEPVAYVQRQLGHASIQLIVDTYGNWLPMQSHAAVERLDCAIFGKW
jgi:site-specific recombinase XerC